jgi:hypothetical protein
MITFVEEKNVLGKKINTIFTNVLRYDLNEDKCVLRYELRYRDPNRESVAIPDTNLGNGEWEVPIHVLNSWSGSNFYLAAKMCEDLGFNPYSGSHG